MPEMINIFKKKTFALNKFDYNKSYTNNKPCCLVLSVDTLTSSNTSGLKIPKFDNIVASPPTFDDLTHVLLPPSISPSMAEYIQQVMAPGSDKFYVSYIMFDTLGELLPRGAGSLHSSVV